MTVLGLAALGVSGCSGASGTGASGPGSELADGRTFTVAVGSDPGNLDPARTVFTAAIAVGRYLYDPLIHLGDDGRPVPGLAERWRATATTATFTLRAGLTCTDGSPLTARDVAANIDYVGNPKNNSPLAGLMVTSGTKAKADDATRTVTVTSGAPDSFLLTNVGSLPIVCAKGMRDRSTLTKGRNGTGMFTMTEAVANDHYTLTRRKDYAWGPGRWDARQRGLPDQVRIRVIPNETTAANLLLSGEINAAAVFGPEQKRVAARRLFRSDSVRPMGELFFNQAPGRPAQDPAVRRALVQALNLNDLGKVLTNGTGKPSKGMVTLTPRVCTGDTVTGNLPAHDDAAAKAALDAAGWAPGAGGVRAKGGKRLSLTVLQPSQLGPTMTAGAELLQKAWRALGAEVVLKPVDSPAADGILFGSGAWDVDMGPIELGVPSQLTPFVSGPTPPKGVNYSGIRNKEFDDLVKKASAVAGAAGCPQWEQAESALIKRLDVVPFYDAFTPVFGNGTSFRLNQGSIVPSSIRMYAR